MEYIDFYKVNDKSLTNAFLNDLNNSKVNHLKILYGILSNKKNKIKITTYKSKYENLYKIMVSIYIDNILISLGRKYNFPRGFPILYIPNRVIKLFGFYPKFDNDDRVISDDTQEFDDITSLEFFKKWSGFLGQLCVFYFDNKICWSCCSKNSADCTSSFIQNCKRLFEKVLSETTLINMLQNNYHLSAEIMSFDDQVHGARVLKETPVITSIGVGSIIYLDESMDNLISNSFVDFISSSKLVEFCQDNKLPCDSAFIIENSFTSRFMKELSLHRDFITDTSLENLINKFNVKRLEGTIRHCDVLGETLEGLVLKLNNKNNSMVVKKYKFPKYVIRTMGLRSIFSNKEFDINTFINKNTNVYLNTIAERWCVTPSGKDFWYKFMCIGCLIMKNNLSNFDSNIGIHIQIADFIENEILENKLISDLSTNNFVIRFNEYFKLLE